MLNKLHSEHPFSKLFLAFGFCTLASSFLAIATGFYPLFAFPAVLLLAFVSIHDVKNLFYLLFLSIPISTAIEVGGGFSTDFPSELLMIACMGICILYLISNGRSIEKSIFTHPISILLLLHIAWIFITTFTSMNVLVSIKYLLAKSWYVFSLYYLSLVLIKSEVVLKKVIWCFSIALLLTVLVVMFRHGLKGFTFEEINYVLGPFYSNHVAYASIMVVCFPFIFLSKNWYNPYSKKWFFFVGFSALLVLAIYLSYTRAAFASLLLLIPSYFVIKFRLTSVSFILAIALLTLFFGNMAYKNTFMEYAPNFEKTVVHKNYDNLLEATLRGEDISTMERFYRWIAGFYMVKEKPMMGYGPGNFYNFYKGFTVSSFRTYVSKNEERSGIHNYFLMVLVEQGIIGLIIFMILSFITFSKGEKIYHKQKTKMGKHVVMMALLSLIMVYSLLIMNDMIETDKVGSFYFLSLALLVSSDLGLIKPLSKPEQF